MKSHFRVTALLINLVAISTAAMAWSVDISGKSTQFPQNSVWDHKGAFSTESSLPTDRSDWLGTIRDGVYIGHLSLPGTHDTMARHGGDGPRTQTMDLKAQLRAGIRVFDFRVKNINCNMEFYHGDFYQHGTLTKDGFTVLRNFLNAHQNEFVIVRLKNENNSVDSENCATSFANKVFEAMQSTGLEYFGKRSDWDARTPKIEFIRGKIILLKDFDASGEPLMNGEHPKYGANYNWFFEQQDEYNIKTVHGIYDKKWTSIKKHLIEANKQVHQMWSHNWPFMNYLSGSGGVLPYTVAGGRYSANTYANHMLTGSAQTSTGLNSTLWPDFPRGSCTAGPGWLCSIYFAGTNELTAHWIAKNKPVYVGSIMADFPVDDLIQRVIDTNKHHMDTKRRLTAKNVCFFADENFEGDSKCYRSSAALMGDLSDGSTANDKFSSVIVGDNCSKVIIYQHAKFQGASKILPRGRISWLENFNDSISSAQIECTP